MSGCYFQGMIDGFLRDQQFGFIAYEDQWGRSQRIFFHNRDIRCNEIGQTSCCWIPGAMVGFKIKKAISQREEGRQAADVHIIFDDPFVGNPADHRENSYIDRFIPGPHVAGFLRRSGGEDLYFCENNIAIDFRDRISSLREGDPVFHGVRKCKDGKKFEASVIELYSREEIERVAKGLPAQEPQPKPKLAPQVAAPALTQDSVLSPATKNVPMIRLILEKRRKS
jgi:cold shock CspA family protein